MIAYRPLAVCAAVAASILGAGGCSAGPGAPVAHSTSYRMGYDEMTGYARDAAADATSHKLPETMGQVVGSSAGAASICDSFLQARIYGQFRSGASPNDFNSRDYLDGCAAAGQDILKSGQ